MRTTQMPEPGLGSWVLAQSLAQSRGSRTTLARIPVHGARRICHLPAASFWAVLITSWSLLWEAAGGGLGSRAWPACASGGLCSRLSGPAAGARVGPSPPATVHAREPLRPRCLSWIARTLGFSARHMRQVSGRGRGRLGYKEWASSVYVGVGGESKASICWEQGLCSAGAASSCERREPVLGVWGLEILQPGRIRHHLSGPG